MSRHVPSGYDVVNLADGWEPRVLVRDEYQRLFFQVLALPVETKREAIEICWKDKEGMQCKRQ